MQPLPIRQQKQHLARLQPLRSGDPPPVKDVDEDGDVILVTTSPTLPGSPNSQDEAGSQVQALRYRYRVHSKSLANISPVFKDLIDQAKKRKADDDEMETDRPLEVEVPSFPPAAFLTFLKLFSPASSDTTPTSLPLLVEVCKIVHHFGGYEKLDPSQGWNICYEGEWLRLGMIDYQDGESPDNRWAFMTVEDDRFCGKRGLAWLFVAWTLRWSDTFANVTASLLETWDGAWDQSLPIPQNLIDDINNERMDIITLLGNNIADWRERAMGGKLCGKSCDAFHLNAIEFSLAMSGITPNTLRSPPPVNRTVLQLRQLICDILHSSADSLLITEDEGCTFEENELDECRKRLERMDLGLWAEEDEASDNAWIVGPCPVEYPEEWGVPEVDDTAPDYDDEVYFEELFQLRNDLLRKPESSVG